MWVICVLAGWLAGWLAECAVRGRAIAVRCVDDMCMWVSMLIQHKDGSDSVAQGLNYVYARHRDSSSCF